MVKNTVRREVDEVELFGRRVIYTDVDEITPENIETVLRESLLIHQVNRSEIQYLYEYYRGKQPILNRKKDVRPEINNKVVENMANYIVSFKTGYLMGEPIQYVARGKDSASVSESVIQLNEYVFAEEKAAKDKELADWFHICGTAFRMALPDEIGEEDEAPFEITTLDPRFAFVVYRNTPDRKPLMGVTYTVDRKGSTHYYCYTRDLFMECIDYKPAVIDTHLLGGIPIVEYPLNTSRLGAFETVIPLLDAINTTGSNRVDGVEQFIQALMVFYNVDISSEDFKTLKEEGAIKVKDVDPQMKARIEYLINNLNQGETQTLVNYMFDTVLILCGMPNRNGGSSTSDTGVAVIYRDGWSDAEARAKDAELMFKRAEKKFLKVVLQISNILGDTNLKVKNIDIRFTRRNYENIESKANVLTQMLSNNKIHPRLAFEHCGMFADPDLAYEISMEYAEEQERKALERAKVVGGEDNESKTNTDSDKSNRNDPQKGKSGGDQN